jgi:hypothetical protein
LLSPVVQSYELVGRLGHGRLGTAHEQLKAYLEAAGDSAALVVGGTAIEISGAIGEPARA